MGEMLADWLEASESSPFATAKNISLDTELNVYKWSLTINHSEILYWFNMFYVAALSTTMINSSVCAICLSMGPMDVVSLVASMIRIVLAIAIAIASILQMFNGTYEI
jgi:hypothetical protein